MNIIWETGCHKLKTENIYTVNIALHAVDKRQLKRQSKVAIITHYAPVAQLDRVLDYESKG